MTALRLSTPLPAVSLDTVKTAKIQLDIICSCISAGDERGATDYLERATMMLIQELRLARKIRRLAR